MTVLRDAAMQSGEPGAKPREPVTKGPERADNKREDRSGKRRRPEGKRS